MYDGLTLTAALYLLLNLLILWILTALILKENQTHSPKYNLSLDQSEGSVLSDDNLDSPDEIDINVDELETPDEADSFEYTGHGKLPRWQAEVKSERLSNHI